ncbi:MAG: hypothetical protein V1888_04255 [archaeon]
MKVQDLIQELEEKPEYKIFKKQNPDTFFAAAFLILDLENKTEQIQLDYYLPKQKAIAAFCYPFAEPKIHSDIISVKEGQTTPAKIEQMKTQTTKIKIDIDDLAPKCKELIKENNLLQYSAIRGTPSGANINPTKIIAILKDDIWNLTCMDNLLGIVRIKLNAISEELLDFNKGGLMDFMGIKKK